MRWRQSQPRRFRWGQRVGSCLSKDDRIRYRAVEKHALLSAGIAAFFLSREDLKGTILIKAMPRIIRFIQEMQTAIHWEHFSRGSSINANHGWSVVRLCRHLTRTGNTLRTPFYVLTTGSIPFERKKQRSRR